jgi:small subunit ribosomal protein S16
MDVRKPRDGKVIEELGIYDPLVPDSDARCILNHERVQYWLGVGALPTDKVSVLIKKYGPNGTHMELQKSALERVRAPREAPPMPEPVFVFKPKSKETKAEEAAPVAEAEAPAAEAGETESTEAAAE